MKNAAYFAKAAAQLTAFAEDLKVTDTPTDAAPLAQAQNLTVLYIRLAAAKAREIAECLAKQEAQG